MEQVQDLMNRREQNFKAFSARYPSEAAMIRKLLDDGPEFGSNPPTRLPINLDKLDTASLLKDKHTRVLIVAGFSCLEEIRLIAKRDEFVGSVGSVIFVENDEHHVRWMFDTEDLVPYLTNTSFHFLFGRGLDQLADSFFKMFRIPPLTREHRNFAMLLSPALQQHEMDYYKQFHVKYQEAALHYAYNLGTIDDYMEGVRATAANTELLRSKPGIHDLQHKFKGETAVIVGAGPSLDRDIEVLKRYQGRVKIFCVDAAVKPLVEAGIRVDYTTSLERWIWEQNRFWSGIKPEDCPELVAFSVVHTDVLNLFPGNVRLCYRHYTYNLFWEKTYPKGILICASNAGHMAFRLAHWMGCERFILLGMDSCYQPVEGKDGYYLSHSQLHLGFPEWGEPVAAQHLQIKYKARGGIWPIPSNKPNYPIVANYIYDKWVKEWMQEVLETKTVGSVVNTAEYGAKLPFIPYVPAEDALAGVPAGLSPVKKPEYNQQVTTKTINFAYLGDQIASYKEHLNKLLYLITGPNAANLRQDSYAVLLLISYIHDILHTDILFLSMILQNCTRENTELFCKLSFLPKELMTDTSEQRKERLEIVANQIRTYLEVCDKLSYKINEGLGYEQQ